MSVTLPTSLTLANVAALSSAVLTVTPSSAPETNAKRSIITALASGTAAGFRSHTVSDPFDLTVWAPKTPRSLPNLNANGIRPSVPNNTHAVVTRKGLRPAADVVSIPSNVQTKWDVPAGSESYDSANLALMLTAHAAALLAMVAALYDNSQTGSV